jgi:hypothetical protein
VEGKVELWRCRIIGGASLLKKKKSRACDGDRLSRGVCGWVCSWRLKTEGTNYYSKCGSIGGKENIARLLE